MESIAQQKRIRIDIDGRTAVVTGKDDLYQGDSYANEIVVEVLRGGAAANLTGYTASGEMQRSDEAKVPCEGSVAGNVITITLNPHCYKEAGGYMLSVKLSKSTEETARTVLRIFGEVQRAASGPTVDISETLVDVDAVLALYEEMKTATREAEEAAEIAKKVPIISTGGLWAFWDAVQKIYVESGYRSIPSLTFRAETGAPGTNVQMVITGTPEEPIITLTIPRGDTGAVDGLDYYDGDPEEPGEADPGTSNGVARGNHRHPLPRVDALGVVSYAMAQALTAAQQLQALGNVGGVAYGAAQQLTDEQKAQARENINAGEPYSLPEATESVLGGVKLAKPFAAVNGILSIDGEPAELVRFIELATYSTGATIPTLVPFESEAIYLCNVRNQGATVMIPVEANGFLLRGGSLPIESLSGTMTSVDTVGLSFTENGAASGTLAHINRYTFRESGTVQSTPTSIAIGPVWMLRKIQA